MSNNDVDPGLRRTLKDLFAGALGGVAQVLLGQSCVNVMLSCYWDYSMFDHLFAFPGVV